MSEVIEVNLSKDNCKEYSYWSDYMKVWKESAVWEVNEAGYLDLSRTKRNEVNKSTREGFRSIELPWDSSEGLSRTSFLQDIYEVNTSMDIRQGKPLGDSYRVYPIRMTNHKKCNQHHSRFIACIFDKKLVAYIIANFCGEIAAASQIMGHGEWLDKGIMANIWLRFMEIVANESAAKYIVYSRWNDGFDGLKQWKKAAGMKPVILKEKI